MTKRLVLYITFILCNLYIYAGAPRFSIYQSQSYIPYSNINDMVEDSYGFLWIATENGLIKFNGYDYEQYLQNDSSTNSLPNNNCRKLLQDSHKRLWVGTDNGVAIYNYEHDNFNEIPLVNLLSNNIVYIQEDEEGNFWVQTFRELVKLSSNGSQIQIYPYTNGVCMHQDKDKIWLGSLTNGLHLFDKKTGEIKAIIPRINNEPIELHVKVILPASDGNIYIGTRDLGLVIYNPTDHSIKTYSSSNMPSIFYSDYVLSLYEDSQKNIWIGSVNGQLIEYNPATKDFHVPHFKYPSGVEQLTIGCIMEDSKNDIWAGTHHYWIYQCNRDINTFELFQRSDKPGSLSHNAVTCFSDNQEKVLIGTDGGGLNIYDKETNKFSPVDKFGKIILDIKKGALPDEFWISTWGYNQIGVVRYDIKTGTYKIYKHTANDSSSITSNLLRSILIDGPYVWVSTDGGGICRINTQNDHIDNKYNCKELIFSRRNPQWVNHLMKDHKGRLWACSSEGIMLYDGFSCKRLPINKKSTENLQNEVKMSIETSDGEILFVTANNGLIQYNETDSSFINLSNQYHLPLNLNSICEDKDHNLWIISIEEIIRLNKETGTTHHFNLRNDLNGNPFTPNAIYHSGDKIYVGSNNGYLVFNPNELNFTPEEPQLFLNNFFVWGKKQIIGESSVLTKTLAYTDTIILNHNENSISIDYFCIDYKNADLISYAYQMKGFQNGWTSTGNSRQAYFTNLSPGTYTFLVKATNIDSSKDILSKSLTIIILPPWWKTWWFKLSCVLALLIIFYLILYIRSRDLKKKQVELENLVAQRTEELQQKNIEIQDQKENLEIQNKRLDESLVTKNKILSVIAHDLRNPLTAIVGNLTLMSEENSNDNKIKQICKSAKNLQSQMENLLDWARIQNQNIFYSPKDCFLDALTKEGITLLQALIIEKNIHLTFTNQCSHSAYIDQRMISTVIRNLLNNAIKFTNEGGNIQISITDQDDQMIRWTIQDDGVGMTEKQTEQLFDKNSSSTTFGTKNEKGSGLGLKICQDFILFNKGSLNIQSQKNVGTTISISLPKGELTQDSKEESLNIEHQNHDENSDKKHLLIVDDSAEILSFICDLLKPHYHIESATNGEDALFLAKKELPDLIISDIIMPKMDGRELCHCIKEDALTQHIPVILLTSEDTVDDQVLGLNIGADDYITKPFNSEILKAKIATLLKNKELQRDHVRNHILRMPDMEIPESMDDTFIAKINDIIKENISTSNLSVEFLASETAISRVQLFRKMKAITGCSPSEYIKAIRLEHAAQILKQSKQNISEVAYMVGFSDPKYFSNCFSEKFGVTPSQYAKNR